MPRPISAPNFPPAAEAKRGESSMRKALPMGGLKTPQKKNEFRPLAAANIYCHGLPLCTCPNASGPIPPPCNITVKISSLPRKVAGRLSVRS